MSIDASSLPYLPTDGLDIVICRRRAGLLQYQLAQRLSMSPTILCDLEHDRRELTPDLAERVLAACSQENASTVGKR